MPFPVPSLLRKEPLFDLSRRTSFLSTSLSCCFFLQDFSSIFFNHRPWVIKVTQSKIWILVILSSTSSRHSYHDDPDYHEYDADSGPEHAVISYRMVVKGPRGCRLSLRSSSLSFSSELDGRDLRTILKLWHRRINRQAFYECCCIKQQL
jgi:hypothetical protein